VQELTLADQLAPVARQLFEDAPLGRREVYLGVVADHPSPEVSASVRLLSHRVPVPASA
jgi:hypothetical protein